MVSCPYVPPHEFDLDFPHLMLRARAAELKQGQAGGMSAQLSKTDRNGKLAALAPGLVNWAGDTGNKLTRPVMEAALGVHREAALPKFHGKTFALRAKQAAPEVNAQAPAHGRKAVLYATCFVNYNNPGIGEASRAVSGPQRCRDPGGLSGLLRHAQLEQRRLSPRWRRPRAASPPSAGALDRPGQRR